MPAPCRRALIVGMDDYPGAPLAGCVADAQAVTELLARNADGTPNFACRTLTAPPESITAASLLEAVDELFQAPADVALFYFSGHGTENNLGGYLVTPDARRYQEGVAMDMVLSLANQSAVVEAVIILDCCNSGSLGQVPAIDNTRAVLREGVSVIAASRSNEPAVETAGRGLFTALLCDALDGGASDVVGTVTAASAYAYVDQALGPWDQRPLLKAHVSRLTSLRQNVPAVPADLLRQLPGWFPDPHQELALDPGFEPTESPRDAAKESVFAGLQHCQGANLVEPVGEVHMYYAAVNSKSCRLTALGRYYWQLANSGRL